MSRYQVALMRGDGIGPELAEATLPVIEALEKRVGVSIDFLEVEGGDASFKNTGIALPSETIEIIKKCHVCMKGPIGETAGEVVLKLRQTFDLYANVRPLKSYPNIPAIRPDIDLVFVRENTEDVYRGIEFMLDADTAVCFRIITKSRSEKIAEYAFRLAKSRTKKKVTIVHKANVMKLTCGMFANSCRKVAQKYPEVAVEELYVDAAAMHLIRRPQDFDVIVTTNLFGDILSDEAAQVVGSLGLAPGANVGDEYALFEPIHGSAPDLAGKQMANPCSMILASKLMMEWLGEKHGDNICKEATDLIEKAVIKSLRNGVLTPDLGGKSKTKEVGLAISKNMWEV